MAVVYIWDINVFKGNFGGHAGCSMGGVYITHRKRDSMARGSTSYSQDKSLMGYNPKHSISVNIPRDIEMLVGQQFERDKAEIPYQLVKGNNCANMVAAALILATYMHDFRLRHGYLPPMGSNPYLIAVANYYFKLKACGWNETLVSLTGSPHATLKPIAALWTPWDVENLAYHLNRDIFV